jgi:hypothetical protein
MELEIIDNLFKYISVIASVISGFLVYIIVKRKSKADKNDDAILIENNGNIVNEIAGHDIAIDKGPKGWLIINTTNKGMLTFPLELGRNDIGRNPPTKYNSIQIVGENGHDLYMSRFHFTILVLKDKNGSYQYFIYDEMSTNGTYINGEVIGKKLKELTDNSLIRAGKTDIIFRKDISNLDIKNC